MWLTDLLKAISDFNKTFKIMFKNTSSDLDFSVLVKILLLTLAFLGALIMYCRGTIVIAYLGIF